MKRSLRCLIFFSAILSAISAAGNNRGIPPSVIIGYPDVPESACILLPDPDVDGWLMEDEQNNGIAMPLRIGAARRLPDNAMNLAESLIDPDYGLVRRISIRSPGALALKLRLENIDLPDKSAIYIYAEGEREADRYEGRDVYEDGSLWSWGSPGETIILEWHWDDAPGDEVSNPFDLKMISHIYKDIYSISDREGGCHNDATCDLDYRPQRDATAYIEFNDSGTYLCSGVMLNSLQQHFIPYFLTANHCIYTDAIAHTMKAWFFFHTEECNGPRPVKGYRTVAGASLLATGPANGGSGSDYSLLRLNDADYSGVYFAGWDRTPLENGLPVTGVHHPDGAYKRISYGTIRSVYLEGQWGVNWDRTGNPGVTEVGSSGSALFLDSNQRVVGQLWAGSSDCSNQNGRDFYGRFAKSFLNGNMEQWLGTAQTCPGAYWSATEPTPTPAPSTPTPPPALKISLKIVMPAVLYHPGDLFGCAVTINNSGTTPVKNLALFVILDVYGDLFFLPGFTDFGFYPLDVSPGETVIDIVPVFEWPDGTGNADSIFWYAGCTDTSFENVIGNIDSFMFGWTDSP